MPLFVKKSLHGTDTTFTLIYSVVSIGSFAGALAVARRQHTDVRHVVVGAAAFGASLLAMALSPALATSFVVASISSR